MHLKIDRSTLLRALSHAQSVVEKRNTMPIAANVLLRASDGRLSIGATDFEIELTEVIPADVLKSGAITVPAHTFHDIVRKLPDGVTVEIDAGADGQIAIKAGRSRFKLSGLDADDFPALDTDPLPCRFMLSAADLAHLIDRTRFAMSTEETRFYLNGIFLHAKDGNLRAVATDGHRLGMTSVPLPAGAETMPGIIIPRKAVAEMRKLIDGAGEIFVSVSDGKIRVESGEVILTSKLIDGTYPDYERVVPQGNDKSMVIGAKTFAAAVDRVSTVTTEKTRAIKLTVTKNSLKLEAYGADAASAGEEIDVDYAYAPIEVGFNSRYLADFLSLLGDGTARLVFDCVSSPTIIKDVADERFTGVIMPMRV